MSWMDSWCRPAKGQATPAPYYLTNVNVPYCQTCGRVIGARKVAKGSSATEAKYCSDRCKKHKPSQGPNGLERRITDALTALLQGESLPIPAPDHTPGAETHENRNPPTQVRAKDQGRKGDPRPTVVLSELELAVFGDRTDPEKVYGRRKNRRARWVPEADPDLEPDSARSYDTAGSLTDGSLDDEGQHPDPALVQSGASVNDHIRAAQIQSEVNFSVGGERGWGEKISETPDMLARRREGQRRAEERELVRNVARRAVVFGIGVDARFASAADTVTSPARSTKRGRKGHKGHDSDGEHDVTTASPTQEFKRKCEALMNGQVIEPSFAKGDWAIRFRED